MARVSVLVPVYNAEAYLEQCLWSLRRQTLTDLEILCVDDGSTDRSAEILAAHRAQDSRVVIVTQANGGYGRAMNVGLAHATGDWIGILEADDYADADFFATMVRAAKAHRVDLVKSDFFLTWTTPNVRDQWFHSVPRRFHNRIVLPWRDFPIMQSQPAIWSNLYRTGFLREHGLIFLETPGASYQDTSFNYLAWMNARSAFVLPRPFVHYRQDNAASSINDHRKLWAVSEEMERVFSHAATAPHSSAWLQILQGIAYKTYRWNMLRVDDAGRREFVPYAREHFRTARDAGVLSPAFFEEEFFAEMCLLLRDPSGYLSYLGALQARLSHLAKARMLGSTLGALPAARITARQALRHWRLLR